VRLGVVIPSYEDNPENLRIQRYLEVCTAYATGLDPTLDVVAYLTVGPKVEADIKDPVSWAKRDRAIAKCRWDGTERAFREGAEWVLQVDTDVIPPMDFFWHMLSAWKGAEAKTCHVVSTTTNLCRHLDDHMRQLPDDVKTQAIAGEVIMLKRSLWDRMEHDYQPEGRANEDFEIAEKVRKAGALYHLVHVRCYSD
jgi:hypothetical protein